MTKPNPRERDDDRPADQHHLTQDEQGQSRSDTDQAGDDGQVSEAGSGRLNQETAEGGADSVPDTPDTSAGDDLG